MTSFGLCPDGREAGLFVLRNAGGSRAELTDYGATLVRLFVPDRAGRMADVVLGFDRVEDYVARSPYFGCVIGRVGNRIAHGRFSLGGREYRLALNNTPGGIPCHLHGGLKAFDKARWSAEPFVRDGVEGVTFRHHSPDGEEGYPGNVAVTATYTLTADHALRIDYTATTDQPTPINLTNHSYFNLAGEGSGSIREHVVTLRARQFTPVNAGLIPLGHLAPVAGTPLDFTEPHAIGERIDDAHEQLQVAGGYDHNFVADATSRERVEPALIATVRDPASGRVMDVLTTEPGVQFYTGNFLDGSFAAKNGHVYGHRHGFCLETQHFPDSPNQPAFPSVILPPGKTFRSSTLYRFSAR